jgi:hypothetical protein
VIFRGFFQTRLTSVIFHKKLKSKGMEKQVEDPGGTVSPTHGENEK